MANLDGEDRRKPARPHNPYLAGALGRCPVCGRGALFNGYLKLAPRCDACGFDFVRADSGDGPAVFIILIVGFIASFGLVVTQVVYRPPIWVQLVTWPLVATLLSLALLRPAKGLMLAAQFSNRAAETGAANLDQRGDHDPH